MKKKRKFVIKNRHLLAIMTFFCISAIALTVTNVVSIKPLRNIAGMMIVPFQNGINDVGAGWPISRTDSGTPRNWLRKMNSFRSRLTV